MVQPIVGYLARCDWDDVELSTVVPVQDCVLQLIDGISVEWIAETTTLRVKSKWNEVNKFADVELGGVAVDLVPECSLKFCTTRTVAEEWLQTQMGD